MKAFAGIAAAVALAASVMTSPVYANDSAVGSTPPEIEAVRWYNTMPLTFEQLQGRAVLVEVFRTWCGACKNQIPSLNSKAEKGRKEGLVIIGVTDEPAEVVDQFVATYQPTYPIVITKDNSFERHLGVKSFPTAAVIDTKGDISWLGHFGFEGAVKNAQKGADRSPLWPEPFAKAEKKLNDHDMAGAYAEVSKTIEKKPLDDEEAAFGARAKTWLESEASTAFTRAKALVAAGSVYMAMTKLEPYVDGDAPFPEHQEMVTFLEEQRSRDGFKDEMKAGGMLVEANDLARNKRTVKDAIEMFEEIVRTYAGTAVADVALNRLDELEKYR